MKTHNSSGRFFISFSFNGKDFRGTVMNCKKDNQECFYVEYQNLNDVSYKDGIIIPKESVIRRGPLPINWVNIRYIESNDFFQVIAIAIKKQKMKQKLERTFNTLSASN
jgi:hypothetical protein